MFKELMGVLNEYSGTLQTAQALIGIIMLISGGKLFFYTFLTSSDFEVQLFSKEKRILHKAVRFVLTILGISAFSFVFTGLYKPFYNQGAFNVSVYIFLGVIIFLTIKVYIGQYLLNFFKIVFIIFRLFGFMEKISAAWTWLQKGSKKIFKGPMVFDIFLMWVSSLMMGYILFYCSYVEQVGLNNPDLKNYLLSYSSVLLLTVLFFGFLEFIIWSYQNKIKKKSYFHIMSNKENMHYLLYPLNKNEILFSDDPNRLKGSKYIIYNRKDLSGVEFHKTMEP